jgi:Leucine Rich repeat
LKGRLRIDRAARREDVKKTMNRNHNSNDDSLSESEKSYLQFVLEKLQSHTRLTLSGERELPIQIIENFAAALRTNTVVTHLELADNNWNPNAITLIANALCHNITVKYFCLYRNNCGPAGAEALANMLKCNNTITTINLSRNQIGSAGAKFIAMALGTNQSVSKLYTPYF